MCCCNFQHLLSVGQPVVMDLVPNIYIHTDIIHNLTQFAVITRHEKSQQFILYKIGYTQTGSKCNSMHLSHSVLIVFINSTNAIETHTHINQQQNCHYLCNRDIVGANDFCFHNYERNCCILFVELLIFRSFSDNCDLIWLECTSPAWKKKKQQHFYHLFG